MKRARPARRARNGGGPPYDVHPGVAQVQAWVAGLPQKTGRSLEQWLDLVRRSGPTSEKERREWLKGEHKLGTNAAWWIAERAEQRGGEDSDPRAYPKAAREYVAAPYAGSKAGLRPIYDRLLARALGDDVRICPCKTMVPLYRRHVFAEIKASTRKPGWGRSLAPRHPGGCSTPEAPSRRTGSRTGSRSFPWTRSTVT